jgi:ADP-heptose:LPS heptosyltransferase
MSLNQSASIIKQSKKVITSDTGLMHIAAAYKKNIISIWGNTIPEFGMGPYMAGDDSQIVEVNHLSCRPCSKLGYRKCPKGHFKCMNEIDLSPINL